MTLWLLVLICCTSMILKDAVGIFMTVAEAKGNASLTALLNPLGTIAGVAFWSFGAASLLLYHGDAGILAMLPVLVIDTVDGYFFTKWARRIKSDDTTTFGFQRHKRSVAGFHPWKQRRISPAPIKKEDQDAF